jgi:hypothetical protein
MNAASQPQIVDISAAEYHADAPCPTPSLSSSIAKILLTRSPLHAWTAHPRLNPAFERTEAEHFDIGTIAHAMLLQGVEVATVIEANDWRTKAAQEQRDEARRAGRVPILRKHYDRVVAMVESAREQLARHRDAADMFTCGLPEQTILWEEDGVWLRARLDWLHTGNALIDDYKTTGVSAHPDAFTRTLYGNGYDIQEAFYRRAVLAATGIEARFRFCVQETAPPHALTVVELDPGSKALGDRKVEEAIRIWRKCLKGNHWPGYPDLTCFSTIPPWAEAQWLTYEEFHS